MVYAFNSLSRDHKLERRDRFMLLLWISLSTPSLGITRMGYERYRPVPFPFNSLSRDHLSSMRSTFSIACSGLSTPSLGITRRACQGGDVPIELSTPSLGITLGPEREGERVDRSNFQLPLSGSRDRGASHTFASAYQMTFNSLSRDHRTLFRDFPALRGFPPRRPFAHLYFFGHYLKI